MKSVRIVSEWGEGRPGERGVGTGRHAVVVCVKWNVIIRDGRVDGESMVPWTMYAQRLYMRSWTWWKEDINDMATVPC